jgi:hypothetical protein
MASRMSGCAIRMLSCSAFRRGPACPAVHAERAPFWGQVHRQGPVMQQARICGPNTRIFALAEGAALSPPPPPALSLTCNHRSRPCLPAVAGKRRIPPGPIRFAGSGADTFRQGQDAQEITRRLQKRMRRRAVTQNCIDSREYFGSACARSLKRDASGGIVKIVSIFGATVILNSLIALKR